MIRYALRRIWQAIPTVFGVALVTFLLFNVVGGSPALQVLGPHASAASIEDFNEVRGYNKPLFWGRWVSTEILRPEGFATFPAGWSAWPGARHVPDDGAARPGALAVAPPDTVALALPLAFEPPPDTRYRLRFAARVDGDGWRFDSGADDDPVVLEPGAGWRAYETVFTLAGDGAAPGFVPGDGELLLDDVELVRGIDRPWDSQFIFYLRQIVTFDFGTSHQTHQPISRLVADGIGPSLALTLPMFVVGLVVAVAVSLICAFWRGRWPDRLILLLSVALMSINYLVYIIAGQYLLAFRLRWFPIWGFEGPRYLVLPVLIGVVSGLGANVRFYRTVMLDEVNQDYVRTARAKGCPQWRVMFVHVLRNAMIPILTRVVVALPFLYTGSLLMENFFGIPGLGHLAYNAIQSSDFDIIKAYTFVGSLLFVAANLLTDLLYAVVDPRVRLR